MSRWLTGSFFVLLGAFAMSPLFERLMRRSRPLEMRDEKTATATPSVRRSSWERFQGIWHNAISAMLILFGILILAGVFEE